MATEKFRPTLKDVARQAGVSIATASRALADNPAVAASTRERIQQLASDLGYRANAQARALRSSRSNTIGVIVPSLINHYFAAMVTEIQSTASKAGLATIITNSNEDATTMSGSLEFLTSHGVDGIICVPNEECANQLEDLQKQGMPVVLVDRELPADSTIPTVTSNPQPGIAAAVELLAHNNALPIGYLSGPMDTSTGRERLEAFKAACANSKIGEQLVFLGGYEQSVGFEGATKLLGQGARTLFAGDSMMTIGVIEACHKAGLVIGKDVSVIGFDTHPLFALQPHPLTVIDQNVEQLAQRAVSILTELIAGTVPSVTNTTIPTALIQRESVINSTLRKKDGLPNE